MATGQYFPTDYELQQTSNVLSDDDQYKSSNDTYALNRGSPISLPRKPCPAAFARTNTFILHDPDYSVYENVLQTAESRSESVFSRPEDTLSPRSSLISGSSFSQPDSNISPRSFHHDLEKGLSTPGRLRHISTGSTASQNDVSEMLEAERSLQAYRTILEDDAIYSVAIPSPTHAHDAPPSKVAEVQHGSPIYQTSFRSRPNFRDKAREEMDYSSAMWRILLYMLVTNPVICTFNAFYTVLAVIACTAATPFSSQPLSISIINRLSRPLSFHFRMLSQPLSISSPDQFVTIKLLLVHMFSPFMAMALWLPSMCVGMGWLYGLLLSDEDVEIDQLRDWVLQKWEGYLLKSMRG